MNAPRSNIRNPLFAENNTTHGLFRFSEKKNSYMYSKINVYVAIYILYIAKTQGIERHGLVSQSKWKEAP